jgi:hypothetical protein
MLLHVQVDTNSREQSDTGLLPLVTPKTNKQVLKLLACKVEQVTCNSTNTLVSFEALETETPNVDSMSCKCTSNMNEWCVGASIQKH